MQSGFEKPITIRDAINKIDRREFLLPALQRQFVWDSDKIEMLFDSLMRDYPVNSFMLWQVTDQAIKDNLKFYEFLKKFRQHYNELNPEFTTKGYSDFFAVIDGQQRLTSIYIGLKGSYAYKQPNKRWRDDEESIPTRYLCLDLSREMPEDNERKARYNFQFLTKADLAWYAEHEPDRYWYQVGDVLTLGKESDLDNLIEQNSWFKNKFAKETIRQLRRVIHERPLINYYLEQSQDLSTVLDIFIRTNSGGEPLSFSDLLMSVITASWKKYDARQEIPGIIKEVFALRGREFQINKDFVLKTCLVLLNDNIRFQIKNFDQANVVNFESHWPRIRAAIRAGFDLVAGFGLSNFTVRAKNAVIPIIYFIYMKGIESEVNHPLKFKSDKLLMQKWLIISLLKGVFGGQSDGLLTKIRGVIRESLRPIEAEIEQLAPEAEADRRRLLAKLKEVPFPLDGIKTAFAADPAKNLTFDEAFIEELLQTAYESPEAYLILSLLYPQLDYFNQDTHKDHVHPADFFRNIDINMSSIGAEDLDFFRDSRNWNTILNLQMLNSALNLSKQDKPLAVWVHDESIDLDAQLIPSGVSLGIADFPAFIAERRKLLREKLKALV